MGYEVQTSAMRERGLGRSVLALLAGFAVNVGLSLATDLALEAVRILPQIGQGVMDDKQSLLAAAYRTIYGVVSSWVVAKLAPYAPLGHAMVGGVIGVVLATIGVVATWDKGLGPHWYAISLVVTALPAAWVGGKLGSK